MKIVDLIRSIISDLNHLHCFSCRNNIPLEHSCLDSTWEQLVDKYFDDAIEELEENHNYYLKTKVEYCILYHSVLFGPADCQ